MNQRAACYHQNRYGPTTPPQFSAGIVNSSLTSESFIKHVFAVHVPAQPLDSPLVFVSDALVPVFFCLCLRVQGVVRAHCEGAGWVIEPVDAAGTACRCTYFSRVDLRGDIPKVTPKSTTSLTTRTAKFLRPPV